jgi:hypothetical protein
MTRADLFREYARVIEMCSVPGCTVDPDDCVRCLDKPISYYKTDSGFSWNFRNGVGYTFALCIVEDKPVFADDVLYIRGHSVTVDKMIGELLCGKYTGIGGHVYDMRYSNVLNNSWSWNPPTPLTRRVRIYVDDKQVIDFDCARGVTANFPDLAYNCDMDFVVRWKK